MNPHMQPPAPPKWLDKLLEWFCPDELLEEVQGDLHERYYLRVQQIGEKKARKLYFSEVLAYIRHSLLKRKIKKLSPTPTFYMLNTSLKTGWRNMLRNKAHSLINISGLALGIACCLLIFLVVRYELSYDSFHSKADRIYRVNSMMLPGKYPATGAPMPVAAAMKADFPEVEQATSTVFF
jgi:putative ABC transport system permease protein